MSTSAVASSSCVNATTSVSPLSAEAPPPQQGLAVPKLSFGLPIFNGQRRLARLLDSIQGQTFKDFELVISDNHSTDDTAKLCTERALRDARIRFHPQPANVGIVANFNRVFTLARGEYFRWIGADDWLEPTYAEECVSLLGKHPEAIGVTAYQVHWGPNGERHYAEYRGPRVDSPLAHQRFARCLSLLQSDYRYFDPMYAMHRRQVLERTRRLRPIFRGDQMLAAELSLLGPYVHVAACLANRNIPPAQRSDLDLLRPPGASPLDGAPEQFIGLLHELIEAAPLTHRQKLRCYAAALVYYGGEFEWTRIRPIRAAIGKRLRDWGVPMDRLPPFR